MFGQNVNDNIIIGTNTSINVTPKDPITNYQLTITDEVNYARWIHLVLKAYFYS